MKTALKAVVVLCVIAGGGVGMYFWFEQYQIPTVRNMVEEPIYTVAGPDYAVAISEGKQAVSYGPLPGSAFYPGSLAFKQPDRLAERPGGGNLVSVERHAGRVVVRHRSAAGR